MDQKGLDALRQLLAEVFEKKWADENHPQYSELHEKFLFHMMDASVEICRLGELFGSPASVTTVDFAKFLHRFFLHALPHLVAAGQLYDYVPQIFAEQNGVHSLPTVVNDLEDDD